MRPTLISIVLLLLGAVPTLAGGPTRSNTQQKSADGVWQQIDDAALRRRQSQRPIVPNSYRTFVLNLGELRALLARAPQENADARGRVLLLTIPMPDGAYQQFRIERSPVAEPGLIGQFPELGETYRGQGVDDPAATVRLDFLPSGFHAMILAPNRTVFVDPYATGDRRHYISYDKSALSRAGHEWVCGVIDGLAAGPAVVSPDPEVTSGSQLRTYRLALAATNEYAVAVGGNTVAGTLAAQTLIINRVNGVYERELAVHVNVVANNNLIVYAGDNMSCGGACNSGNDPYANDDGFAMLAQNQTRVDLVIGNANYDVGHVFSTGGGGIASLGVPCFNPFKAQGVTGLPNPTGDTFAIDYVAHEMGHQFGANHSFNGNVSFCAPPNRFATRAFEVGSGITIMAYPGLCGNQNLALHSIDSYHVGSLEEMVAYLHTGMGNTCAAITASGNTPPSVAVVGGPAFSIPKQTPFTLTASASDINGDSLTYSWEEYDLGAETGAVPNTDSDGQARPIFKPYAPTASPARTFPALTYILNNANVPPSTTGAFLTGELLPAITRAMSFQVVVRDNRANAGGINTATATVNVDGASGPFAVTAPNTGVSWAGGSNQTVTWNVMGTSGAPVNAANVKISLSTDGGFTFPTTVLASTLNDGSETITVPNSPTGTARIKVEAVGNIFFDISNVNFTITPGVPVNRPALDFDGDGKTDVAVVRANAGSIQWFILGSTSGFTATTFGLAASDVVVPGDYDGDGKWDIAVWRPGAQGYFFVIRSSNSVVDSIPFGTTGDDPRITQDYDADGKADPAVTRNIGGNLTFFIQRSLLGFTGATFGTAATDVAIRGDFDGDNKADIAVYRKHTGAPANTFFLIRSSDNVFVAQNWGIYSTDNIVPADFDGDHKTDYAVWRGVGPGTSGTWFWLKSSNGTIGQIQFGVGNLDLPVVGDYDGDGTTDQAVFRPGTPATFYLNRSTGGLTGLNFGQTGDSPPGATLQNK